jgi:hypothetical protein
MVAENIANLKNGERRDLKEAGQICPPSSDLLDRLPAPPDQRAISAR